jgi:Flp pilus assembly pilin Flp
MKDERGTAAAEFAIAITLVIVLLVATVDLGRLANGFAMVRALSSEGAYYAMLHPGADAAAITSYVRGRAALLDTSAITVDAMYYDGTAWHAWQPHALPSPAPSGAPVKITITYPWRAATTLVGRIVQTSLASTSVMDALP